MFIVIIVFLFFAGTSNYMENYIVVFAAAIILFVATVNVVITISIICVNTIIVMIVIVPCLLPVFAIMKIYIFFHVNLSRSLFNCWFVKLGFG